MPHWYVFRRVLNRLRYGVWTTCQHPHWIVKEVRYAQRHDQPTPMPPDERWTVCLACGVVRARRKAQGV